MPARRWIRGVTVLLGATMVVVAPAGPTGGGLVAPAPAPAAVAERATGDAGPAAIERAVAEVAAAVVESGRPPCGMVTVSVAPTDDGRSWAWPRTCHILLDAGLVTTGGGRFRYIVRHEIAHLHTGVDHYAPGYRALEARLADNVGFDLVYHPGEEYPEVIERAKVPPVGDVRPSQPADHAP